MGSKWDWMGLDVSSGSGGDWRSLERSEGVE